MVASATKISWMPDTGLPNVHHTEVSGSSQSAGLATPNIWQREKQELKDGHLVPPLDLRKQKRLTKKSMKETAGSKWFNMSSTTVTPELKRELQLLRLRGVLDPKRHYKANDSKNIPKFFQVGTVVEGSADFYSGRLTKKERKLTFADELLTDTSLRSYSKRKYLAIQGQNEAGGKRFWKKKKNRQKPSWAKS